MKTIKDDAYYEYVINKSKFISYIYKVNNMYEVNKYLDDLKVKYSDATHICYGYVVDNNIRFNDDGEPGGTAGMPILNVLTSNDLNYTLAVVIRYFGGIKLGAGGLVRAYSRSTSLALKETTINDLIDGYIIELSFNYDKVKLVDNIFKDYNITKEFNESIIYKLEITKEEYDNLYDKLINNNISIKILDNIKIAKD